MTQSTLPDNWQELLAGYVLGDLEADETAQVERWIETSPEAAAEWAALQTTWDSLPQSLSPQAPPPNLRQTVLAALPPPTGAIAPVPPRSKPLMWGMGLGWMVTAIALVAVITENQQLREEQLQSEAIVASFTAPRNRLVVLTGTETEPEAQGRLVIDPDHQEALIATQSLAPLPEDEVYRLWAVIGETPTYCGEFNPDQASAINQWALPEAACDSSAALLLVTREQADAPPTPQGDLVLQPQS